MAGVSALHGVLDISKRLFSFAEPFALKCAIELRLPDIIHSHGKPISLSQIASGIDAPSVNLSYLERILRMLVRMNIFTTTQSDGGDTLYGSTPSSLALLHDDEISLAPFLIMQADPLMVASWQRLSDCVKEGGSGFKKAHGTELFDLTSVNPEFNKVCNDGMRCSAKLCAMTIFPIYKDGFKGIETLVDVGGGVGHMISEIVKEFPHIKGINFDLPHVVATAPKHNGVTHVGGNMFKDPIPETDAIFIKSVLHDWGDSYCLQILKNIRNALAKKNGKLIIVDLVLEDYTEIEGVQLDLNLMAYCVEGKGRTELEWRKILEEGGFSRLNFIKLPTYATLIEAYPA